MRAAILALLMCAHLISQQPNSAGASMFAPGWTTYTPTGVLPYYTHWHPGPTYITIEGWEGQYFAVFATDGIPTPGALSICPGIVDLDLSQTPVLLADGYLSGTFNPSWPQTGNAVITWTVPNVPLYSWTFTLQAIVVDPVTSSCTYTLSAATEVLI